jgi:hypothetical protein
MAFLLSLTALMAATPASAQWRYPYPGYYAPPMWRVAPPESNLRLKIKPKDASVYVDGFFAGKVDDFDGAFQRLHVAPGQHELVIYLEGYRSLRRRLYLSANATRTIDGSLERLASGQAQEPPPQPAPEARMQAPDQGDRMPPPPDGGYRRPPPRGPIGRPGPTDQPPPPPRRAQRDGADASRYASLAIRVQPDGAKVLIDGESWDGPSGDERLIVQVAQGHHVIEVDRDGFEHFQTELDVRSGETRQVNISLRRR